MSSYSVIEKKIARFLAHFPTIKCYAKYAYLRLIYFFFQKKYNFNSHCPIKAISNDYTQTYYGYYDKSPLSPTATYIIYQSSLYPTIHAPDPSVPVEVVLSRADDNQIVARFSSSAYNWQQGTRLQWISDDCFAFNAYDAGADRYVAHVCDATEGRIVQTLPMPAYDCFGNRFALTLSFDRLARLAPDYGYFCRMDHPCNLNDLKNDGIFWMDMRTGHNQLVLSLATLAQLNPLHSMKGAKHSVNHIMIGPDGKRFTVIHRWYQSGRRYDRLVLAQVDGSNPIILADEGMVSHFFWLDHTQIFGFLRHGGRDAYYMLDTDSCATRPIGQGVISGFGDGHPHVHGSKVVFDTYPDKARMKQLFLYDLKDGTLTKLGEFFEGFRFDSQTRCDLHPRFSPDGRHIFFDSVHEGNRKLYRMDLLE